MLRLITRHGQVDRSAKFFEGNHLYTVGEFPLSELGREQARLLGERLKAEGFKGKILASPYLRTMETANIIAGILGLKVIPFALLHETTYELDFVGKTIDELREIFDNVDENATLEYPWWPNFTETVEQVDERGVRTMELAERLYPDEPILYVGHGASVHGLSYAYKVNTDVPPWLYNCALTYVDSTDKDFRKIHCDSSHIPYEMTTSNQLTREEFDKKFFEEPPTIEPKIPEGVSSIKGQKLLHIGDTESRLYPYYKKLIEEVKPDIILHTGDFADEVKVGRIPEARYEYLIKLEWFSDMLNKSGARLIIVPGNNDLEDEIKKLMPSAEVYPINTAININGVDCKIGHQVLKMTFDKEWSFYGHGYTGEEWQYAKNTANGEKRFNVCADSYIVSLEERKFYRIPDPRRYPQRATDKTF